MGRFTVKIVPVFLNSAVFNLMKAKIFYIIYDVIVKRVYKIFV